MLRVFFCFKSMILILKVWQWRNTSQSQIPQNMTQLKQEREKKRTHSIFLDVIIHPGLASVPQNSSSFQLLFIVQWYCNTVNWGVGVKITGGTSVSDQCWDYLLISEKNRENRLSWPHGKKSTCISFTVNLNACSFISVRRLFFKIRIQQTRKLVTWDDFFFSRSFTFFKQDTLICLSYLTLAYWTKDNKA